MRTLSLGLFTLLAIFGLTGCAEMATVSNGQSVPTQNSLSGTWEGNVVCSDGKLQHTFLTLMPSTQPDFTKGNVFTAYLGNDPRLGKVARQLGVATATAQARTKNVYVHMTEVTVNPGGYWRPIDWHGKYLTPDTIEFQACGNSSVFTRISPYFSDKPIKLYQYRGITAVQ